VLEWECEGVEEGRETADETAALAMAVGPWTQWGSKGGCKETHSSTSEMIIMSDVCFVLLLSLLLLLFLPCHLLLCVCLLYDLCLSDVIYSSEQMLKFDLQ